MNQEIKQRWVEALRSGGFQQTQEVLACDEGMCCLGVLLHITDNLGDVVETEANFYEGGEKIVKHNIRAEKYPDGQFTAFPSMSFLRDVCLSSEVASTLAELNDDGYNFNYIADAIEKLA